MAAPTDVRVYAVAAGIVTVRWVTDGSAGTDIYRSPDGVTYANVGSVAIDVDTFDDTGLSNKTKYWYKLTDDAAMSFSSVVTVVTHTVISKRGGGATFTANQAKGDVPTSLDYNEMVYQLEDEINVKHKQQDPCGLCIVDGAIVIDCMSGCDWFRVVLDQDINSISLIGCDDCPQVDFIIPPEETFGICGWPMGCDFGGDECHDAPLEGGPTGRVGKTNGVSYGDYGQANGPTIGTGGGSSCQCEPGTTLGIQCCEDSCTLDCNTNPSTSFRACGGLAPYTWSVTGNVALSSIHSSRVTVTAVGSSEGNPAVSGIACVDLFYNYVYTIGSSCPGGGIADITGIMSGKPRYNCDGTTVPGGSALNLQLVGSSTWTLTAPGVNCAGFGGTVVNQSGTGTSWGNNAFGGTGQLGPKDGGTVHITYQFVPFGGGATFNTSFDIEQTTIAGVNVQTSEKIDVRTASMVSNDCPPCADECDITDATITLTDSVGTSVTLPLD